MNRVVKYLHLLICKPSARVRVKRWRISPAVSILPFPIPIPVPESLNSSLAAATGNVWAGPRGEQPEGRAIPASRRLPAPYRR